MGLRRTIQLEVAIAWRTAGWPALLALSSWIAIAAIQNPDLGVFYGFSIVGDGLAATCWLAHLTVALAWVTVAATTPALVVTTPELRLHLARSTSLLAVGLACTAGSVLTQFAVGGLQADVGHCAPMRWLAMMAATVPASCLAPLMALPVARRSPIFAAVLLLVAVAASLPLVDPAPSFRSILLLPPLLVAVGSLLLLSSNRIPVHSL